MITVLVDSSASMRTPDAEQEQTRFAAASAAAGSIAESMGSHFDVEVQTFDAQVRQCEASQLHTLVPTGEATDLDNAIRSQLNRDRPAGQAIVLLSDGIHNTEANAARVLDAAQKRPAR